MQSALNAIAPGAPARNESGNLAVSIRFTRMSRAVVSVLCPSVGPLAASGDRSSNKGSLYGTRRSLSLAQSPVHRFREFDTLRRHRARLAAVGSNRAYVSRDGLARNRT